ncbi:hypothetical protein QAD02_010102 [Eretmocerus hayati]|uniref:Uncharacterized protein n=1 Tax=Eretmocerus hayati TaxID=131215 RepID=A0ACC2NB48_9HYME|nr:hypothetical protein QAD02_010102 [Eretmocerus hayati]
MKVIKAMIIILIKNWEEAKSLSLKSSAGIEHINYAIDNAVIKYQTQHITLFLPSHEDLNTFGIADTVVNSIATRKSVIGVTCPVSANETKIEKYHKILENPR